MLIRKSKRKTVVASEDAKLNMTPMIDMTFLLVVFFMLTIDLSQKEFFPVDLPYAREGVEDKEDPKEVRRFIINLTSEGKVHFKNHEFELSHENPVQQDQAIIQLRTELSKLHQEGGPQLREPDGASKVPVLVHADHRSKWKYVQWIMQACAHPDIKIYKIQFAVKKPVEEGE